MPLVSGKDLIDLGLTPGKIFKDILSNALEIQIQEGITDKKIMLSKIQEIIKTI